VGHIRIASVSIVPGCITPVVVVPLADDLESDTVAVGHTFGQEEDPLPPVRCADFRSCEQCRRNAVTHLLKFSDDGVETRGQMCGDVLAEDVARLERSDVLAEVRPEVAWVVFSAPLASL
jgi:hypothetical protein